MEHHFYILYSKQLDRFYIGHTSDELDQRLRRHNTNHKGFTGRANDWRLCYCEVYPSKSEAKERESQVKSWKSRKRLFQLLG
ncbi:GIY-YIG nuclease family protein [Echinicola soli]|uniref:GIY-YIG nuclease family protein n=1 Tax=Echinicola soli TaxID=2591634 RepID=A0A514CDN8_9BACT|nr:GIY-YIG nuclease family protein [Echinicola soli]QDH77926.1 GIY-YIG nuclease family protein [Echinicola soli]